MNDVTDGSLTKALLRLQPELRRHMDELNRRLAALTSELETARAEIERLKGENASLSAEQATIRQRTDSQIRDLQAARDGLYNQLKTERANFNGERTRLEAEKASLAVENKRLQGQVESLSAERDDMRQRADSEIRDLQAARDGLYNQLKSERADFNGERKRLNAEKESLAADNARMKTEVMPLEKANADQEAHIGELREKNAQLAQRAAEWRARFEREEGEHNALKKRWNQARLRPILMTTMPKSGTYYISSLLAKGLGVETTIVSNQYFPHDTIRYQALKEFATGNFVSQDHFSASDINLTHIANFTDRMICHVRDPRQAMLSYIHYIDEFKDSEETFVFIYPPLPRDFFELSLGHRIDWGIDNWLPLLVEWASEWVAASKRTKDFKIMFTRYEDFIEDPQKFLRAVLKFAGIPQSRFIPPKLERSKELHFRKGEVDEWRDTFTKTQQRKATALIPQGLAKEMGWSLETKE